MNYTMANKLLTGRNQKSKKVDNNTYLIQNNDNIAIKLHNTEVIKFYPDKIVLNSGGWYTPTTKDRLNSFSGYQINQESGIWHIGVNGKTYKFNDNMVIYENGTVENAGIDTSKEDKKFKAQVKKFAENCSNALPLDKPGNGDCWYCAMVTTENKTLGDSFKDTDHLKSHIEENYIVPSLVYHALKEKGVTDMIMSCAFNKTQNIGYLQDIVKDKVKTSVYRYILKRFGFAC